MDKSWDFTRKRRLITWILGVPERVQFAWRERPTPDSALIVAGSGRSGTSWLSRLLTVNQKIQLISEPLNPRRIPDVRRLTGWKEEPFIIRSFYLPQNFDSPEWHHFLEMLLTGQIRAVSTDYERTSFLPQRYLIKLIRGNLMLGYIYNNFSPKIIYVIRHPCATVISRLNLGWQADTKSLLQQEALVEDYLYPWVKDIEKEKDPLGKHAIMWAVENYVAQQELANIDHLKVTFEALCLFSVETTTRLSNWADLGISPKHNSPLISEPSRHSRRDADYSSTWDRLNAWKNQLSAEEIDRILFWSRHLGLTEYSENVLPYELQE